MREAIEPREEEIGDDELQPLFNPSPNVVMLEGEDDEPQPERIKRPRLD